MNHLEDLRSRFVRDFRSRFVPIAIALGLLICAGLGWFLIGGRSSPPPVDPYTALLRTGVMDVTRPSPRDPSMTEVVRFHPDGRVQVLERFQTEHFRSAGGNSPSRRETPPLDLVPEPAHPNDRAGGIANAFQRR